jgi:hypothetical protein
LSNLSTTGQPWVSVQLSRLSFTTEIFDRRLSIDVDGNMTFVVKDDPRGSTFVRVDGKLYRFLANLHETSFSVAIYRPGFAPSNNTRSLMKDEADFFSLVTEEAGEGEPWQEYLFGFDMCWENVSTSEATAFASLKNETLHVYGHSFNLYRWYRLNFSASGHWIETEPAHPSSHNLLATKLPPWDYDANVDITVVIYEEFSSAHMLPCSNSHNVLSFRFASGWSSVNTTSVLASGGQVLEISGVGFAGDIVCELHPLSASENISIKAEVLNSRKIRCLFPGWLQAAPMSVGLKIVRNGAIIPSADANPTPISIQDGWDFAIGATSLNVSANGNPPEHVFFHGYGFDTKAVDYDCLFFDPFNMSHNKTTSANVVSSTNITCLTPAWGIEYAATRVEVSLQKSERMLLRRSRDEARSLESLICPLSPADGCSINFVEVWRPSAAANLSGSSFGGGDPLIIDGYGFDTQVMYWCVFNSQFEILASPPATPESQTRLICEVPALENVAGTTQVTLKRGISPNDQTVRALLDPVLFQYVQMWRFKDVSKGPAKGGTHITVTLRGFDTKLPHSYSCVFFAADSGSMPSENISMQGIRLSAPLNLTENVTGSATCLSPYFPYSAQKVIFSIEFKKGGVNSEVEYESTSSRMGSEEKTFEFTVGWDYIVSGTNVTNPSSLASGGSIMDLHGYGFNSSQYFCRFNDSRVTSVAETLATLISPVLLRCLTPSFSTRLGGRVNVLLKQHGVEVPYTAGGMDKIEYCNQLTRCSMEIFVAWSRMFPGTAGAGIEPGILATGGMLQVEGFGFDPTVAYICRVKYTAGFIDVQSTSHTESTQISFAIPALNFSLASARQDLIVEILDDGSVITSNSTDMALNSTITFFQTWTTKDVSEGPVIGGTLISVSARGLSPDVSYACYFELEGEHHQLAMSDAALWNSGIIQDGQAHQRIECEAPPMSVQALANFSILGRSSASMPWTHLINDLRIASSAFHGFFFR